MTTILPILQATWPAARIQRSGPVTLRLTGDGGRRVNAASYSGHPDPADLGNAETAMRDAGQPPLWMVDSAQTDLDQMLADCGYRREADTLVLSAPAATLAGMELTPIRAFRVPGPALRIQRELWAASGIGPDRLAIMDRVEAPKITVLGRVDDSPGGTMFAAAHGGSVMIHALTVVPAYRRKGLARWMMINAARWARDIGATVIDLAVEADNDGARAFYDTLGFAQTGAYHYRILEETPDD